MSIVKQIASEQYKALVNHAAKQLQSLYQPKEGWLATIRNALGMSVIQLARRLGVTRAHIYKTEKAELTGHVTIKTMQSLARGMNCHFVYAIVPEDTVEAILAERARKMAERIVETTHKHTALEDQALPEKIIAQEIERMQKEILNNISADFWEDEP